MALTTASNWLWNFLISFFTTFITNKIDFAYGYVFAGCCFFAAFVVFFGVIETRGRTLEEIDYMYFLPFLFPHPKGDVVIWQTLNSLSRSRYVNKVLPWRSSSFVIPPQNWSDSSESRSSEDEDVKNGNTGHSIDHQEEASVRV